MNIWVRLPDGLDAALLLPLAEREGVAYVPGRHFAVGTYDPGTLRLSFAGLPPDRIEQGIAVLGRVFRQELENGIALTTHRRSLYYSVHPEEGGRNAMGDLFDAPNPQECYRRTQSIVPQQALALTNSDLVHRISERIAADYSKDTPDDIFIAEVFRRILTRKPTAKRKGVFHTGRPERMVAR